MLKELLLGCPYAQAKRLIERTEYQTAEDLAALQRHRLSKILAHAVGHVPYYARIADRTCHPDRDPISFLKSLPMVDKGTIRANPDDFRCTSRFRSKRVTTGGSTGQPLVFFMDRFVTRQTEKAFMFDQWKRAGYRFGDPIFNLRGRMPSTGRFIHHDRMFNIHSASSLDLNRATLDDYVSAINKLHPRFLHGYPSTMYQLATLMEHSGKRLQFSPAAVFCGSEKLFPYQKERIEAVFECRTYHWYGHSEYLALGGGCECSDILHFFPQYGYTELIPSGVRDELGRELFEIVATGFNNPVMPLIRYRTGDFAIPAASGGCRCGRNYLLIDEVVGRQQEFLVDAKLTLISATSLIFGQHFAAFEGLESIRLHQKRPGEIDIIMVKGPRFHDALLRDMRHRILDLLGSRMSVRFLFAANTEKTVIGKARLVEQELDPLRYLT